MLIYKITSPTGKIYIGQTSRTLKKRKSDHYKDYKRECRTCPLYEDMIKYGFNNFKFETIQDNISSQTELDEAERYWISFYNACNLNIGYNQDSGGKSGGTKSDLTKAKIGETSKEKWNNKETAAKMLNGLRKGTETTKRRASENYVECICNHCGKKFYMKPFEAKNRKYCSLDCLNKHNKENKVLDFATEKATLVTHNKNVKTKNLIRDSIIKWCTENKDVVMNCPRNRISTTLSDLFIMLHEKYGYKDKRSYYLCFNVKSLKEFLDRIQQCI